jgi:Hydrogenase-1 expression protein HyaE
MHPLLEQLLNEPNARLIDAAALPTFLSRDAPRVVMLTGDLGRRAEALDVAVVVREFLRSDRRLELGLVDRASEAVVMSRFGVLVLPALVLVRGDRTPELITRIRDWPEYVQAFARLATPSVATDPSQTAAVEGFA